MLNVVTWNAFRNGDMDAFGEMYDTYAKSIYQYGRHFTNDQQLVKDCVQELFTELWERRESLGNTTSVRCSLLSCIRRKIIRKLQVENRRKLQEKQHAYITFQAASLPGSGLAPEEQSTLSSLIGAINQLPQRQREIIYLRYFRGMSFDEIAPVMDLSKKTAYNIVFIALESLRKKLSLSFVT